MVTAPCCPFCGRDPYEYVDIGVGFDKVAVSCCEPGIALFERRFGDTVSLSRDAFVEIAEKLASLRQRLETAPPRDKD